MDEMTMYDCVAEMMALLRPPYIITHQDRFHELNDHIVRNFGKVRYSDSKLLNDASVAIERAILSRATDNHGIDPDYQRELIQIVSSWLRAGITHDQLKVILIGIHVRHLDELDRSICDWTIELEDYLVRGVIETYAEDPAVAHRKYWWLNPKYDQPDD